MDNRILIAGVLACVACRTELEGTLKIAVDAPLSGGVSFLGLPIANGVKLAVQDAGGAIGGFDIEVVEYDDTQDGGPSGEAGAANAGDIVDDELFLALIGPATSGVASEQIPVTNEAGLFQCSPSNTFPGLTLPEWGSEDLRPRPEANNYVRVVTHDAVQGPAGAAYMSQTLGASAVYIIDDTDGYGVILADSFEAEFVAQGGTFVGRIGADPQTADYDLLMTAAAALDPDAIYFGGVAQNGAGDIVRAAAAAGLGDLPFMGGDALIDGPGDADGSFINTGGADAAGSYATIAGIVEYPGQDEFEAAYQAEYGESAEGTYAAMAYACTQIALAAIEDAAADKPKDWADLREGVRAAGVDPGQDHDTVLGPIEFDENGDTTQQIVAIYQVDGAAAGGTGDWAYVEQVDFAEIAATAP